MLFKPLSFGVVCFAIATPPLPLSVMLTRAVQIPFKTENIPEETQGLPSALSDTHECMKVKFWVLQPWYDISLSLWRWLPEIASADLAPTSNGTHFSFPVGSFIEKKIKDKSPGMFDRDHQLILQIYFLLLPSVASSWISAVCRPLATKIPVAAASYAPGHSSVVHLISLWLWRQVHALIFLTGFSSMPYLFFFFYFNWNKNSYNLKFTILKCMTQRFLVYSQYCATIITI